MLKRNWRYVFTFLVVFADLIILNVSFLVALYLRFPDIADPLRYWQPWAFINLVFLPLTLALGLYRDISKSTLETQKQNLKKFTYYLALFTMSYLFLIKGYKFSRGVLISFLFVQYFMLEIVHSIMNRINRMLHQRGFGNRQVLIVGTDYSAMRFSEHINDIYGDYYKVRGFIANGTPHLHDPNVIPQILGKYEDVERLIPNHSIDQVFIVSDSMLERKYENIRQVCESFGVKVKMVSPGIKSLMNQSKVTDVTGVPLTTRSRFSGEVNGHQRLKRFFDVMIVAMASPVLVPLCLAVGAAIKLTSRGPVLFKQRRALYRGGPEFWFYKFRTMYQDADQMKAKIWQENESDGALFKMKKDPRVTPIGRFLRKYSIDEIPQFLNVLKGDMSIVGPRPLPCGDFERLKNGKVNYDWYRKRGESKPGITGLWQISGRSNLSFEEMCMLDLYYIENQSIFFDVEIMFETLPVMIFGKGAY